MNKNNQSKWDSIFTGFLSLIIFMSLVMASLAKVFKYPYMMNSMASLGFNEIWTLTIGYLELLGWFMVLIGLYKSKFKVLGILFLFPFSIGAFTAHMAHQEYVYFYPSLIMCVSSVVLLWSSKNFRLKIV